MALTVRITNLSIKNVKNIMIETNFITRLKIRNCVLILFYALCICTTEWTDVQGGQKVVGPFS